MEPLGKHGFQPQHFGQKIAVLAVDEVDILLVKHAFAFRLTLRHEIKDAVPRAGQHGGFRRIFAGRIPEPEIQDMIDPSSAEVVTGLPTTDREGLQFKA